MSSSPEGLRELSLGGFVLEKSLHGKAHAALFVGFDDLDADLLAFLEVVGDLVDAFVGDLADVKEAVLARQEPGRWRRSRARRWTVPS